MNPEQNTGNDKWDLVIKSKSGWFDINLKELWHYRDLVILFVRRDFVSVYKQTILGPLWHFIQPVFTTVMFLLIFSKIAGIPTDGIHPVLFYMSGITFWNYFSNCLTGSSNTFLANAHIFGKVYFPRLVSPISIVISNMISFFVQFFLLLIVMAWYFFRGENIHVNITWLLVLPLLLVMAGTGLGLGIIISSLTTKYRDLKILIGFGVQLMMYATPVAYPVSFLMNKSYNWLVLLNPLAPLMEAFRYALFQKGTVTLLSISYSLGFMFAVLVAGFLVFSKVERSFMDTV
ncbi:MAG: ABC transporter permease [Bacteroidia bacterium]|nr:ABC transporter permease [Bacteroidia bacterium]